MNLIGFASAFTESQASAPVFQPRLFPSPCCFIRVRLRMNRPVLVIGGGVAGAVCALRLRQHGFDVHLAEKASFPRAKICGCCLGGTGLSVLELVDLKSWVLEHGETIDSWIGSLGGQRVEISTPDGVAISRERLDTEMLDRVRNSGVIVHCPVTATVDSLESDFVTVRLCDSNAVETTMEYELVVVASGLNAAGANRLLPWTESPHGPFGTSFFANTCNFPRGTIGMAVDQDGYVGVVCLEDGRLDVAAALVSGSVAQSAGRPLERTLAILERSSLSLGHVTPISEVMVTPPLRRNRLAGIQRLAAIGDASGYVEPFTGEGMTWGMMSGYEIADRIAHSRGQLEKFGDQWCKHQRQLLASRRRNCRLLTTLLQSSFARSCAGHLLSRLPILAKPITSKLGRPWQPSKLGA